MARVMDQLHARLPTAPAGRTLRRLAGVVLALVLAAGTVWSGGAWASTEDAASLLRRAEAGDSRAAFVLGMRYARKDSESRDDAEAVRWLRKAADQGLGEAQYNLGIMYANGRGVTRDPAAAARWYTLAAEQGIASAQYNLGTMYAVGEGVARDEKTAAVWFERAALQDVPEAAYNLGVLYDLGRGVAPDAATAMSWYERAANLGYHPAASRLAALRAANPNLASASADNTPEPERQAPAAVPEPAGTESAAAAGQAETVKTGSPVQPNEPEKAAAVPAPAMAAAEPADGAAPIPSASSWLARMNSRHYTLQVLSHTDEAAVRRYLEEHFADDEAGYFAFVLEGTTWFSVVYGEFPSYAEATAAGETLAGRIQGLKPWVRKVAIIQKAAIR